MLVRFSQVNLMAQCVTSRCHGTWSTFGGILARTYRLRVTALMSRLVDAVVVKDFGGSLKAPKTSEIISALGRLGIKPNSKVLIILSNPSETIVRSIRNLQKVKLVPANHLNVFDLLNANSLVLGEDALETIQEVYGND